MVKTKKKPPAITKAVAALAVVAFGVVLLTTMLPSTAIAQRQPPAFPELDTPEAEAQAREAFTVEPLLNAATKLNPNPSCDSDVSCYMLKFANWIVDAVFFLPFILAEFLFSWTLGINLAPFADGSPITLAVNTGFRIVLAVANMAFILVLLWIAIATIFDFESFTARKTLPKFIIAALLINFSLPIGKAIINLGNGTANIFYENLITSGGGSIRGVVTKLFRTETLLLSLVNPTKNDIPECRDLSSVGNKKSCFIEFAKRLKGRDETTGGEISQWECYERSLSWNPFTKLPEVCYKLNAQARLEYKKIYSDSGFDLLASIIAAKILIYPVAIFVLFAGAIFLLNRLVVLTFILILGPLAFLALALPTTEKFYNDWWSRLIKWSLFLPAFLFFFWLTFAMINGINNNFFTISSGGEAALSTWGAFGAYLLAAAFMIGSLIVANQFGIAGASTVTGWGKKMAGGFGKWAAGKAGRMTLAGVAPAAKAIEETQNKFLRRTLLAVPGVRRGLQKITSTEKKQVGKYEKQLEPLSSDQLKRRSRMATASGAERAAILNLLLKRRDLAPDDKERQTGFWTDEDVRNPINYLRAIGEDITTQERAVPHIAGRTPEEIETIVRGMKPEAIERLDRSAFANMDFLKAITKYWKQGHFSKMMIFDPRMARRYEAAMRGYISDDRGEPIDPNIRLDNERMPVDRGTGERVTHPQLGPENIIGQMDAATYEYFRTSASQGYGYKLPSEHERFAPRAWTATQQAEQVRKAAEETEKTEREEEAERRKTRARLEEEGRARDEEQRREREEQARRAERTGFRPPQQPPPAGASPGFSPPSPQPPAGGPASPAGPTTT